ncbi:MAG: hypothetical protein BroJett029_41590 [Alphaproteobacteria bacterium]|nr:MAG: hypothetical protein BroJett029_41590 [Alphaproteobacteria bacterium]
MRDQRPISDIEADVLVVGGGAAGVAAATTAARQGVSVVLLERYGFCGGGAVASLSGTVCGLYFAQESDNARPKPLVGGFAAEFVARLEERGGITQPIRYGKTFTRTHDPLVWREVGDSFVEHPNIRVVYHALVTEVLTEGGERIAGVVAYTKQGKLQVRARLTVDASGDADVAAMAGLETAGDGEAVQNPTMIFRLLGVDVTRFLAKHGRDAILGAETAELIRTLDDRGEYRLPRSKVFLFPTPRPGELLCNCTRILGRDGRDLDPLRFEDLTEAEVQGRLQVREYARFIRDHIEGCDRSYVNDTGVQVGIRQTRQIRGVSMLRNEDVVSGRKRGSGIARSAWPIEMHRGTAPKLTWLFDDFYEVPYECFVPEHGESLLVAGRCLAAESEAMASARVTAQCFSYGHAIGHAAAIAVQEGVAPRAIDPQALRFVLNRDGAMLDTPAI